MNILTATKRSKADKLDSIRNNGMIPAVVYGARMENTLISVPSVLFTKLFKIAGETSTIVLEIAGETEKEKATKVDVLIHEIQADPIRGFPIHIDFLAIDMNKEITVSVPVEFTGIETAEKASSGVLVKVIHEVEVEALPKNMPHEIIVDVSSLVAIDDQIHISDIKLSNGVKILANADEVVALLASVKEEVVEESAPVDLSSIEVEKKGKKEEESTEEK